MTSPNQASVGNVHADIVPDVTGFRDALKRKIEALDLAPAKVKAEAEVKGFARDLKNKLDALTNLPTVNVNATPTVKNFNRTLRGLLDGLPTVTVKVNAEPTVKGFNKSLRDQLKLLPQLSAKVNAEPDVANFAAKLQAALTALPNGSVNVNVNFPNAAAVGTAIGTSAATAFVGAFNAAIAAATWNSPGPSTTASGAAGGRAGGAYAATFRAVVTEALRNLPEPTIGVATSAAEQAIRDIRVSLERLANERVGVTITTAQARAEVERIRADLVRLRALSDIDVDIDVNARGAFAALAELDRRLNRIGNNNNGSSALNGLQTALLGSTSRMQLLITAGLALGPAIVPAAAAAAAAIAGIGGAAISAVAGLGVGVLAISGVVGAVKALNDARNEQAKTATTLSRQDTQLASGADQVRSAVASLANTRAQAASQARQSANQIADAERGLADAQRDALRAQQDITRAREEAADALEDLDSAVKNNALSIRQANLDLADAKAALDKVLADPAATRRQREEAQLTYDRAAQQISDLTVRQGRLKEEQEASAKAGVEGSQQVTAAQEKHRDAQERVKEAERSLAEARTQAAEQARQSAFSIAQAQQAVVAAQRSAAQAAVSAASTAGSAMDELQRKMDALSPAGQRFARFIVGLQPELLNLRRNAEQALPGLQRGIEAVLPALPRLADFVRRVAVSLGELGSDLGQALSSDRVRPFFTYIDATAVPTMDSLFRSIGRIGAGIGNMVVAFGPAQRQIVDGFADMSTTFEKFTAGLGSNNRFQQFLDYAITRGPIVLRTIGDIGGAIIHILEASAPAGDVLLTVLSGIAHAIEAIPVPVLTVLLTTMTALRVASLLAAIPVGTLATNLRNVATGATTARSALGGVVSFLGGPWTIAIAAATVGIGLMLAQSAKQRAEIDRLRSAFDSYAGALKNGFTPEARANAQAILAQEQGLRGLVSATDRAGISQATVVAGLNGNRDARSQVIDALNKQIDAEKAAQRQARGSSDAETAASRQHEKRAESLEQLRIAFAKSSGATAEAIDLANKLAEEQQNLGANIGIVRNLLSGAGVTAVNFGVAIQAVGDISGDAAAKAGVFAAISDQVAQSSLDGADKARLFGQILGQLGSAANTQSSTFDALAGTFNNIATSSLSAADKVALLRRALDQMYGASINQVEADENLIRAKGALTTQVGTNSAGFDLNTAATGKNRDAILANRDALQAALLAAREKYLQDIANGVAEDVARAAHEKTVAGIFAGIEPTQRNSKAVAELNKLYGEIPPAKKTDVTTPGLDSAITELIKAHAIQQGIANGWSKDRIDAEAKILRSIIFGGDSGDPRARKADGGLIEGWSPHSRADNIPAWLTAREFVQPVATVDYYGVGAMEAIRRRQIPRDLLRGYASGGLVEVPERWPINIPVTAKMPVSLEELWRRWEAAQAPAAGPWPSSPGAQRGDSGVWRGIVKLIQSTGPLSGYFGNSYRPGDPLWHGCVPMDTAILTRRGWITHDQIRVGEDETIGYNPATGRSEWTRIVGMYRYDNAELWTITDGEWCAEVTPGHRWLTEDGMRETRNLRPDSRIVTATPLADEVDPQVGLPDGRREVVGIRQVGQRHADVFCPTTTLGTWTARQGEEIFLTGNSGRAVDWMGFNQDALAQFFMARQGQLLEFIHRTGRRDYAVTRGQDRGSFNNQLMEEHRNHIHVAMADGGLVKIPRISYDTGGGLPPGLTLADNRTGGWETVRNAEQEMALTRSGGRGGGDVHIENFNAYADQSPAQIAKDLYWESLTR